MTVATLDLGLLLRRWRTGAGGVTAVEAASALDVGRSAVSNWESSRRQPDYDQIARLDALYGAGGALIDVAFGLESPAALDPRRAWWHNCPPGGAPAWAWIRPHPDASSPRATAFWGAFRCDTPETIGPEGVVLAVDSSVPNPPIRVVMDPPGWVDFGRSEFPGCLGVPVISVLDNARLADLATNVRAVLPRRSIDHISEAQRRLIRTIHDALGEPASAAEETIGALEHPRQEFDDLSGLSVSPLPRPALLLDGDGYARLRRHRRMSRSKAAELASGLLAGRPVSDDQLEQLEAGGHPRGERIGSRLDTVYRADGHTCIEFAAARPGPAGQLIVEFPGYWVGPVWVSLLGPPGAGVGAMSLEFPPWRKNICARSGLTVTFRRPVPDQVPLVIRLQEGWTAVAGIGHVGSATDINDGWQLLDADRAATVFPGIYTTYLKAFGLTHRRLAGLLRSAGEPDRTDQPDAGLEPGPERA